MTSYVGSELALFANATNWKRYVSNLIGPFIQGRVLEVGAGLGKNIPFLINSKVDHWTCLEPDRELADCIQVADPRVNVINGVMSHISRNDLYDVIIYIDVLEHIADDREELVFCSQHLVPGGHLIVLSPAHPFLFSPFDAAIGHCRRYTRGSLLAVTPPGCRPKSLRMVDSVGLLASLGNRLLLRSAMPTARQIAMWDWIMVPMSRRLDPLLGHRVGKSVIAVWQRNDGAT